MDHSPAVLYDTSRMVATVTSQEGNQYIKPHEDWMFTMPNIFDEFVVLKPNLQMDQLHVSPDIYEKLDAIYDGFRSHTLVSAHQFSGSWPTWEIHPAGDEMVILLSGSARFKLRLESGDESIELKSPGSFLVVPKNTWHTAIIDEPTSMLFVTPGEGTLNETTPPGETR